MTIGSFIPSGSVWTERLAALAAEFPEHEFLIDPDVARALSTPTAMPSR